MQETSVGWNPSYVGHLPWFANVFVLYLTVALLASMIRAVGLARRIWRIEEKQHEEDGGFRLTWEFCQAKTASIRRLSALTFLLSVLVLAWSTAKILQGAADQKVTGSAFLAGAMAAALTEFAFGIFVCAVLYGLGILCEGLLVRRKIDFARAESKS